jgi:hypothetical protein
LSSINIENEAKREKMRHLLRLLNLGRLPREYAGELKSLLIEELKNVRAKKDIDQERDLAALIKILDSYIFGKVDLMVYPDVVVSNIT